ncbi:MAG: diacylglycerol kinase family protein [Candidatus Omnitrophota bacterium]
MFQVRGFRKSLRPAFLGITYLYLHHRNMRIIFISGILAFLLGVYFHLTGIELITLCITITLVFMAEIFNTAIELLMNMLTEEYHIKIRMVKDIAAGIVVLACLNALAVAGILFLRRIIAR